MAAMISTTAENHINLCMHQIETGTFDQITIAMLLLNLRDFADRHSFTREIGDFVAHPEKDRGIALSHAEGTRFENKNGAIHIYIVMPRDGEKLIEELRDLIISTAPKSASRIRAIIDTARDDILLCYLGILHRATLVKSAKKGKAVLLGVLRAKCMGSDPNLAVTVLKSGHTEFPLISTKLLFFEKCAANLKEFDENHRIMALRKDGDLKLRRLDDI